MGTLVAGRAAAQDGVQSQVRVGGGYDSNPAFAADPSNRRAPVAAGRGMPGGPHASSPNGDGLARVTGFAAGQLGSSPRGSARFDIDGRIYGGGNVLFWERLTLQGSLRVDDVSPRCRAQGSRLDLTVSGDSSFSVIGGCGIVGRLPFGFWASIDADGGVRLFDQGQTDGLAGGEAAAGWATDIFAVDVGLTVTRRESTNQNAQRTDVAPWITLRLVTTYVGGQITYRYVERLFDSNSHTGGEHTGMARVWGMPLPWLGAYADIALGHAAGNPQALTYDRFQVTAGARLVLDWRPEPSDLPAPALTQGPATLLDDGFVRFAFELPNASEVSVIGDFDDWDPERGRLHRRADGLFEGRFEVGSGRHEYSLIVDGEPVRPPGAERYASDGFGGENAILVVPGAP